MSENLIATENFDRTLSKALVHKTSIDQVLLSAYKADSEKVMHLFAQLPRSNCLYCESMIEAKNYDLAALIEICRQACFVVAHTQYDVPLEGNRFQFILQELKAVMIGSRSSNLTNKLAGQVIPLVVKSTIERVWKRKSGQAFGLRWLYSVSIPGGAEVAQIKIRQTWIERLKWREIRQIMHRERGISADLPIPAVPNTELLPSDVARLNIQNVVLHRMRCLDDASYEALARIDTRHPVFFDRATEHIYAMIQIELCRQMSLYVASKILYVSSFELEIWECDSKFLAIGELNIDAKVSAIVVMHDVAESSAIISLKIIQQKREISVFEVSVRRVFCDRL